MILKKQGMRNIKTGIAVMICILVGYLNIIDNVFFAATACIVSMKTTVKSSLIVGRNRLMGTFIGGIIGFLFVLIKPGNPVLACLGIISTIYICNLLNINQSVTIACVVFCAIFLSIGNANPIEYSFWRIIDNSIGVLIGVGVNYYIHRPNYLENIYEELKVIETISMEILKSEIEKEDHADTSPLEDEITKLDGIYINFLEELEYIKNEVNDEKINKVMKGCKEIYLHLQVLAKMKYKCYLNTENYKKYIKLYNESPKNAETRDYESPVYNYHIGTIIDNINEIRNIKKAEA